MRESTYFKMVKNVSRRQHGRGARFMNHKVTTYNIMPRFNVFSSAWRPSDIEISQIIGFDPDRSDISYPVWHFDSKKTADKTWILLGLKWS